MFENCPEQMKGVQRYRNPMQINNEFKKQFNYTTKIEKMLAYIMNPAKLSFSNKGEKDILKNKLLSLSLD